MIKISLGTSDLLTVPDASVFFSFLDYKLAIFVRQALYKDKLNTTWCCLEFFHLGLASRFEGICIGHGRVGWRSVASEDAWDMGQRNGNSFYLAGSSQMAEFKEYLSLQRDFYPNKGHSDASCHIMMYSIIFWDARKYLSKKLSSIFLSPKKKILDEFRFIASGVSWKMGPIYIAKICRYLRKLVVLSISFGLLKEPCFCGFLWRIVVWYSQAEPGAATAPLSPAAKWLGITFELQHSSKRFAFCFNQITWYDTRRMWYGSSRGRKYTTCPKPGQV